MHDCGARSRVAYHARTKPKGGPVIRRSDVLATRYHFILAHMLTLGSHVRLAAFYRFGGFLMTIGFLVAVLIGRLWSRYAQETCSIGFQRNL
jgi:hypothetical protein